MIDLHIYGISEPAGRRPDGLLVTGSARASADELDSDFGHSDIPDLSGAEVPALRHEEPAPGMCRNFSHCIFAKD